MKAFITNPAVLPLVLLLLVLGGFAGILIERNSWITDCTYAQRHVTYESGVANVYKCPIILIDESQIEEY